MSFRAAPKTQGKPSKSRVCSVDFCIPKKISVNFKNDLKKFFLTI
jgi:hypothetical protein